MPTQTPAHTPHHSPAGLLVIGLSIGQVVSWGALYYAFSVISGAMEADLHWSRTAINGALSLALLVAGLFAVPVGQWIDRHGGFWPLTLGAAGGGVALVLWSRIDTLPEFYLLFAVIGILLASALYEPAFAVLTAKVQDYKRAITIMTFFGGLASTVFIPLTSFLVQQHGWRTALLVLALVQLAIPAALNFLVLRGQDAPPAAKTGIEELEQPSPLHTALRKPAFWGLFLASMSYGLVASGLAFHMIPMFSERGVPMADIVLTLTLIGPCQVLGRALLFFFGNKASVRPVGRITFALAPLALLLIALSTSAGLAAMLPFAVIYGMGLGMSTIVRGAGIAELLGTKGYGAISGALAIAAKFAMAASPVLFALLWQSAGSYQPVVWSLLAVALIGLAGFWYATVHRAA